MWIWSQFQSKWVTKAIFGFLFLFARVFFIKLQSKASWLNQIKPKHLVSQFCLPLAAFSQFSLDFTRKFSSFLSLKMPQFQPFVCEREDFRYH
jgi:hypothetical protein